MRREGYRRILKRLRAIRGEGRGAVLEVGSAHGWFLEAAAPSFDRLVGIEPDDAVRRPGPAGAEVRPGYFPDAVDPEEAFDAIVFNDSFEHIPGARGVATAVASHLREGGIAVINLPVRGGAIYRAAALLSVFGANRPFRRMWKEGLPSPHLYYFSESGLSKMLSVVGLVVVAKERMPTVTARGLWKRIRYGGMSWPAAAGSLVAALALVPALAFLPPDVVAFFFEKRSGTRHEVS